MGTITPQAESIAEYKTWVSTIDEGRVSSIGDILWALVARDAIAEIWNTFSDEQMGVIARLDETLKARKEIVSEALPSSSSTPQARAEGRWWWFLNE